MTEAAAEGRGALARNAVFLLLAQLASTALAVVLSAGLGRMLGPAEFGIYVLASSMAGFAYVVVEWGQGQYVVRELAQDPAREAALLGTTQAVRLAGAAVMTALTGATGLLLGYDARTSGLAALFVLAMLPFFLAQGNALVFRSRERMEFDAASQVVDRVLTLGFTLALLWLGAGVLGAAGGVGAGGAAALLVTVLMLRRLRVARPTFRRSDARAIVVGGAAIVLTNVESSVQSYIDPIVLSKLGTTESVGWFGAARTFVGTLVAPSIILSVAAYPRLSRAARNTALLREELHVVLRPLIGLGVLAAVGAFLFAPQVVDLVYGDRGFGPAAVILQVLAPGLLLLFLDNLLASAVVAVGRPRPLAIAKLLNIVVCTALAVLLVPWTQARYGNGGVGLAIASGASEVIMLGAALLILPPGSLDPTLLVDLGRALVAGTVALAAFQLVPPLPLLVDVPLCIGLFTGLSLALGLVRVDELRALPQMMRR